MTNFAENKTKRCSACREHLPLELYGIARREQDGYNRTCKRCLSILSKYHKNPSSVYIHEIPRVYRNRVILRLIPSNWHTTLDCYDSDHKVVFYTKEDMLKVTIYEGSELKTSIEFVESDYKMCMEWILDYLNSNEIWLKPVY